MTIRNYGTFNRRHMEYSMHRFTHKECTLTCLEHYDHYQVMLCTKQDYVRAMPEPTYFDYTSAVTKTHLLTNPYLIPEILQRRDWTRLIDDYDQHYEHILGPLRNHASGNVMH